MSTREVNAAKNLAIRGNYMTGMDQILDKPRACVIRAAALNLLDNTPLVLAWDTRDYDVEGMWDGGSRFTVRTAGLWEFKTWGALPNSGAIAGFRDVYLRKNSTDVYGHVCHPPPGTVDWAACTSAPIPMNAGDYVDCVYTQLSGGTLGFRVASLAVHTNGFSACLISTIN